MIGMEWNAVDVNVMDRLWSDVAQNIMEFLVRGHLLLPGPSQHDNGMNGMEWMDVNGMERSWLDVAQNRMEFFVRGHSSPAQKIQGSG
jgi:hypothetical protein